MPFPTFPRRLAAIAATTAAAALVLTGCGGQDALSSDGASGSSGDAVIIGSADFTESQLIATIYSQALQAEGVTVKEQFNIGSREVYMAALQDGSIDLLPEYSGALLKYLDSESKASTSEDVVAELGDKLPKGVSMLDISPAEDKDVLAVTQETADKYDLKTISDLVPYMSELSLGGPPEWKTRVNGVVGLEQVYGLTFKEFVSLDAGGPLTMTALTSGQVQVGDIFSTDPGLTANKLVAFEDDKSLFAAENIVPVISTSKLDDTISKTLDKVSAALTTEDLIEMNGKASDGTSLKSIAEEWLKDADLG
ncbi:ABC transporter substrate-binding protein [Plantibacter sp. MMLR14_011]|uniref:ABC transporter substrate-binding protein n=1 Tax=Plantibacter sp. MMLR14_011 TaxID=1898746 RepID=UPI0008DE6763|nr:ABC transporter substrate-binding protein [Plantibacter sp. MMLR14_011]OII41508.1 glycine/betaine ABC transporter substrate-binding protein [Plantibacter sp. MMLR14_011]